MAVLDEIDSGLDIDALRDVADAVNGLKRPQSATIMVTHYKVNIMPPQHHYMARATITSHHSVILPPVAASACPAAGSTGAEHYGVCMAPSA